MVLIDSVNHGYGTDACIHYTWNDVVLQMTQVYIFCSSVEASSPLKVLSFIELYEDLLNFMKFYDACGILLNGY